MLGLSPIISSSLPMSYPSSASAWTSRTSINESMQQHDEQIALIGELQISANSRNIDLLRCAFAEDKLDIAEKLIFSGEIDFEAIKEDRVGRTLLHCLALNSYKQPQQYVDDIFKLYQHFKQRINSNLGENEAHLTNTLFDAIKSAVFKVKIENIEHRQINARYAQPHGPITVLATELEIQTDVIASKIEKIADEFAEEAIFFLAYVLRELAEDLRKFAEDLSQFDRIVQGLIKRGVPIDQALHSTDSMEGIDDSGETALHLAAKESGNYLLIKALLDSGANADLLNTDNETARDIARSYGYKDLARLLGEVTEEVAEETSVAAAAPEELPFSPLEPVSLAKPTPWEVKIQSHQPQPHGQNRQNFIEKILSALLATTPQWLINFTQSICRFFLKALAVRMALGTFPVGKFA